MSRESIEADLLHGKRVLVIEDDYYQATDEAAVLGRAGATIVGCTGDSNEARRLIDSIQIDCALLDINLGYGPSFSTARMLQDRKIPFLFTTGYDARIIPSEFVDIDRLEKPVDPRALVTAVGKLFR